MHLWFPLLCIPDLLYILFHIYSLSIYLYKLSYLNNVFDSILLLSIITFFSSHHDTVPDKEDSEGEDACKKEGEYTAEEEYRMEKEEWREKEEEEGEKAVMFPGFISLDYLQCDEKCEDFPDSPRPLSETRNLTASELLLNKSVMGDWDLVFLVTIVV